MVQVLQHATLVATGVLSLHESSVAYNNGPLVKLRRLSAMQDSFAGRSKALGEEGFGDPGQFGPSLPDDFRSDSLSTQIEARAAATDSMPLSQNGCGGVFHECRLQ